MGVCLLRSTRRTMRTINENTATKTSRAAVRPEHNRIWILVFIFSFLGLMIDGADLMLLSYSLTSIKAEFGLTSVEAGSLGSITLAGMAIGGIYGGWACDRFGRVKTVSWTIVLFSIGTAVLGLTHSYFQFAVARFVSSLGLGALYVACNTLMAEYVPTKYRTTALGTLQAGWSVGYIVATVLAGAILPVYGWRYLFFVAIVPVIIALLMHKGVPEPESWVRAKAERESGGSKFTTAKRESAFKAIFGNPRVRTLFIFWALTAGFLQFGYYGVNNWLPSYLETEMGMNFKSMTAYMIGSYTAMILGKVLAGVAADWLGRRAVFALGALGTAAFLPIIVLYHSPDTILWMLVVFGFLYGVPYGVNATYMAESFEAKYRGTAVGGAYNIGRAGAALAPVAIGFFASQISIGFGFLVMGGAYFICGVIPALFIREKQFDPEKQ
ncbi:major facilitator superfamily transporter cis,cis-muconate transporter [Brucella ceti B1/94]|uniref:Sialic acid transporter 2 n=5 Tax=Brucella TaxID=234 RepID=C0G9G0_9HYPH|nr:sialic acid transporter 2 [Brucella ceti str. Cudo]EEX85307.1 major facilitator superfamily transporter cis,cis-muconate transporter [Brucella ceti B1/94]EEX88510.1 major facilitator superfamily transporter cis,cis-muconate transporter [Brucella ceti M13/05/1]EEX95906.1 major facilitator superfamily transporter cis,cis-muconate transporter [Brucella ceti M644/93/1]EEY01800.1 major facilitator transporter [Brucella pinnipedialis B2/94]EEY27644.1 major facilitator superfamily transporter cis,